MSVTDRLKRLTGEKEETKVEKVRELRQRIDAIMSRRPGGAIAHPAQSRLRAGKLEDEIEGEEIQQGDGTFYLSRRHIPGTSFRGYRCVNDLTALDMRDAALLPVTRLLNNTYLPTASSLTRKRRGFPVARAP